MLERKAAEQWTGGRYDRGSALGKTGVRQDRCKEKLDVCREGVRIVGQDIGKTGWIQ